MDVDIGIIFCGLTLEMLRKSWLWTFNNLNEDEKIFVAEDKRKIVGFPNGGKNRTDHTEYEGELYAVYVLKEYQGKGMGKGLYKKQ